jgi:hypothetical protein
MSRDSKSIAARAAVHVAIAALDASPASLLGEAILLPASLASRTFGFTALGPAVTECRRAFCERQHCRRRAEEGWYQVLT